MWLRWDGRGTQDNNLTSGRSKDTMKITSSGGKFCSQYHTRWYRVEHLTCRALAVSISAMANGIEEMKNVLGEIYNGVFGRCGFLLMKDLYYIVMLSAYG